MFPVGTPSLKAAVQGPLGLESQVLGQGAPASHVLAFLLSRPSSAFPHPGLYSEGIIFPRDKRAVMVRSEPILTCHITGPQEKGFFSQLRFQCREPCLNICLMKPRGWGHSLDALGFTYALS